MPVKTPWMREALGLVSEHELARLAAAVRAFKIGFFGPELADLVVSPLGRLVAGMPDRPDNEIVVGKLRTGPDGGWEGAGLVVLPSEKGRGPLRSTRPRST